MNYTEEDILNAAKIGFEFEFNSKEDPIEIARDLTKSIGIKVVVPMNVDEINKPKLKYHTPVVPTATIAKLESDYSGGIHMKELITGPMTFSDARTVLLKTLKWIDDNAWTTDRAAIQINISFDKWKIKLNHTIENINALKFCLNFNEEYVYKRFPNRKGSVYGKSIKHIVANNIFNTGVANGSTQFIVAPNKYYSVNLTKLPNGYVEFRFMGGSDYQKKKQQIIEILEFSILSLYAATQSIELSKNDVTKLNKIINENKKYLDAYKNPSVFKTLFPHINLTLDLKNDIETFKSLWPHVKDKLFKFLMSCGCDDMTVNYDSDAGVIQVKEADLKFAELEDIEFIHCTGYGVFEKCKFYNCELEQSHFNLCTIDKDNIIRNAKIENTNIYKGNIIYDSYVTNEEIYIMNAKMDGGVFRKGTLGAQSELSDSTSIITSTDEKPKIYKGSFGTYKTPDEKDYKQAKVLFVTKPKKKR